MKTLNNVISIKLLSIITIIMLSQSCGKEEYPDVEHKTNYYYLTAAQLNQTPYFTNKAFDTISFSSDKGDTLTFVKTKTDTTWYCENGNGSPNTGYDKDCYQIVDNTYTTIKGNGSFDVKMYKKTIEASLNTIYIDFNGLYFHVNSAWLSPSFQYLYSLGTFKINNRNFDNSIYGYRVLGDTTSDYLILNKEYGVIQLNNKQLNTLLTIFKP